MRKMTSRIIRFWGTYSGKKCEDQKIGKKWCFSQKSVWKSLHSAFKFSSAAIFNKMDGYLTIFIPPCGVSNQTPAQRETCP